MTGHSSGSGYPRWRRWVSNRANAANSRTKTTRGSSPIRDVIHLTVAAARCPE